MSTYLVCFAVHKFDSVERRSASGIPVSIQFCVNIYYQKLPNNLKHILIELNVTH